METELHVRHHPDNLDRRQSKMAPYCATITGAHTDRCGCISCKNFVAQRGMAYPEGTGRLRPSQRVGRFWLQDRLELRSIHLYRG